MGILPVPTDTEVQVQTNDVHPLIRDAKERSENSAAEAAKFLYTAPIGIPAGVLSTTFQSIGLADENTITKALDYISPAVADTYKKNQNLYDGIADISTLFVGAGAAAKLVRSGSVAIKALRLRGGKWGNLAADVIASDAQEVNKITGLMKNHSLLYKTGGVENFAGLDKFKKLKRAATIAQAKNDLREGVAAEAFVYAFQNKSEVLFPPDQSASDLAFFSSIGIVAGVGLGHVVMRAGLKRAAAMVGGVSAKGSVSFNTDEGANIVAAVLDKAKVRDVKPNALIAADAQAKGVLIDRANTADTRLKASVDKLRREDPIPGLTTSFEINGKGSRKIDQVVSKLATTHPRLVGNMISIEDGSSSFFNFWNNSSKVMKKLKKEKDELVKKYKTIEDGTGAKYSAGLELQQKDIQIKNLDGDVMPVHHNGFGVVSVLPDHQPTIVDSLRPTRPSRKVHMKGKHKGSVYYSVEGDNRLSVGVGIDGKVVVNGKVKPTLNGLSVYDTTKAYLVMPKSSRAAVKAIEVEDYEHGARTVIDQNTQQETLDFVLHLLKEPEIGGNVGAIRKLFDIPVKYADENSIKALAFKKRYERFVAMKKSGDYLPEDFAHALNLRLNDDVGMPSSVMSWLDDVYYADGPNAFKDAKGWDDIMQGYRIHYSIDALPGTVQNIIKDNGSALEGTMSLDMAGAIKNETPSFSMFYRSDDKVLNQSYVEVAKTMEGIRRENLITLTKDNPLTPFLGAVAKELDKQKALVDAIDSGTLSLTQEAAAQALIKKLGNLLPTTASHRLRFVPGAAEAASLSDVVQRITRQALHEDFLLNTKGITEMLQSKNNYSALLYNQYHAAMQQGWRLADDAVPAEGIFKLATEGNDGAINKALARKQGLGEVPAFLPEPFGKSGAPLVLDSIAVKALQEMRRYDQILYAGDQTMAASAGKAVNSYLNGHTIYPSRKDLEVVYIADAMGHEVDYVTGTTAEAALSAARSRLRAIGKDESYTIIDKTQVEAYKMLEDQAWHSSVIDVTDSYSLNRGRGVEPDRTGLFNDLKFAQQQLAQVENSIARQSDRFVATHFAGQLEHMNYMQQVAKYDTVGFNGKRAGADVFDMFAGVLLNKAPTVDGNVWRIMDKAIEGISETVLGKIKEITSTVRPGLSADTSEFRIAGEKIAKQYGYDPVDYVMKSLDRSQQTALPVTSRKLMRKAAAMTQFMMLKFIEIGHPILTAASVMTTTPHTMTLLRKGKNESTAAWKARLGYLADFVGDDLVMPNEVKMTMDAVHFAFTPEGKAVIAKARGKGYLHAPIGEFMESMAHETSGKIKGGVKEMLKKSGALTEKSEEWARSIAYLTAYRLFSKGGKNAEHVAMAAANDMANRVIADYRPSQKGELFRGYTGIPLGLFQTFSMNYFQKLFQAIERKDVRELAIRYGTQAAVFGGSSVAGYDLMNERVLSTWNGKQSPEEYFKSGDSPQVVKDLFLYGTLSNVPRLFGAKDGISIFTRGEVNSPRVMIPTDLSSTPVAQLGGKTFNALKIGLQGLLQNGEVGLDQLQEALILAIPNRPLRGIFEIVQGYSTNANGDTINAATRDWLAAVSRLAGLKTTREVALGKALWLNRQSEMRMRQHQAILKRSVTSIFRNGKFKDLYLQELLDNYTANGGSARGFKSWLRDAALKASMTKADRKMLEKFKRDPAGDAYMRFHNITGE